MKDASRVDSVEPSGDLGGRPEEAHTQLNSQMSIVSSNLMPKMKQKASKERHSMFKQTQ